MIKDLNSKNYFKVTTEGDAEGRTTRYLGTYQGHIADIVKALANDSYYALQCIDRHLRREIIENWKIVESNLVEIDRQPARNIILDVIDKRSEVKKERIRRVEERHRKYLQKELKKIKKESENYS